MFQPSPYSEHRAHPAFDHPVVGEWAGSSAGGNVIKGVGSAASAGAASVKVGSLLAAAGSSATVPVAGWIVGGVLAAAAGTVAIVQGVKRRKVSKTQAMRWARSMKLPMEDAKDVAGFVIRLAKKDRKWRLKQAKRLARKLAKIKKRQSKWKKRPGGQRALQVLTLGIRRGPGRLDNQRKRVEAKLGLIQAVERTRDRRRDARERRRLDALAAQAGPPAGPAPSPGLSTVYGGLPLWAWLAAGGVLVAGGAYLYLATRKP